MCSSHINQLPFPSALQSSRSLLNTKQTETKEARTLQHYNERLTVRWHCRWRGIGGLTAANALERRGFRVRVYEQAIRYIPRAGAGFGLSPYEQVCLASLGIDLRPNDPFERDCKFELESDFVAKIREKHGFGAGGCLRADLIDTLSQTLAESDSDCLQFKMIGHCALSSTVETN